MSRITMSGNLLFGSLLGSLFGSLLLLSGCVSQTVKSTEITPVQTPREQAPESRLLDVGVVIFDPGLDEDDADEVLYPEVRRAEARYMSSVLAESIQASGAWGAVRVVPSEKQIIDLTVTATIIESHGEELRLRVKAWDSTGLTWLERPYKGKASRYSYSGVQARYDPFQSVYNEIANDLLAVLEKRKGRDLDNIRLVTELRFAQDFSPDAFDGHLEKNRRGRYKVTRLPAANDPMLERVRTIRERDHLFVDTLQDYYDSFNSQMAGPYQEWRKSSYEEALALAELRAESRRQILTGIAAVAVGVAAQAGDSRVTRTAGEVAILGGGYLVKRGLDTRTEADLHVQALEELGLSLETEIAPQVIELEDRTVTLTGSVQDQYEQWRELLRQIYDTEVSGLEPPPEKEES